MSTSRARYIDEAIADKVVYRQCYLEYKTYDVDSAAHYVKEMEALLRNTVANPHFQRDKKIIPKH